MGQTVMSEVATLASGCFWSKDMRIGGNNCKGRCVHRVIRIRLFGRRIVIPVIHGWGEVEGRRIETSRPIGSSGLWDIVPANIRPVITPSDSDKMCLR